ncbi:hypothetical protein AgCh_036968 [Apium graveolens]
MPSGNAVSLNRGIVIKEQDEEGPKVGIEQCMVKDKGKGIVMDNGGVSRSGAWFKPSAGAEPTLKNLMRQVAGGGDTKAGGIIPQWQEVRRWGHEVSRYYPTMARETKILTYGLSVRPDEDVMSLSGGVWGSISSCDAGSSGSLLGVQLCTRVNFQVVPDGQIEDMVDLMNLMGIKLHMLQLKIGLGVSIGVSNSSAGRELKSCGGEVADSWEISIMMNHLCYRQR